MTHPLAQARSQEYQHRIAGTWGEFATPRGNVSYLMTSARLGTGSMDDESRLAKQLRPVREVLDVANMSFSQLLQRDLDDHRVATELVPYILRAEQGRRSPAFFPSILAVMIPFRDDTETICFPDPEGPTDFDDGGMPLSQVAFGDSFAIRKLRLPAETTDPINYGQLVWNEERARVVVLDGQHRAMALLAVQRTVSNTWENSGRGARYRNFYERRVRALLDEPAMSLDNVRFPVTICWFPDPGTDSNAAARQLFVDVNREARPPSPDRVVLLNDEDLLDIFTREFLEQLRASNSRPPLHAIEYDRSRTAGIHQKWSTISTLQSIKRMTEQLIFGPERYLLQVDVPIRGANPGQSASDENMRTRLRVTDLFPHELVGTVPPFERETLGRNNFPKEALQVLTQEFLDGWGSAIRIILADIRPYSVHYQALDSVRADWEVSDPGGPDALAREAIFGSGSLYWTLRTGATERASDASMVEVRNAWARIGQQGTLFRQIRSKSLVGDDQPATVAAIDAAYEVYSTMACQLGLGLTFATLAMRAGVSGSSLAQFAQLFAQAVNAGLDSRTTTGESRVFALSQDVHRPINRISDMNRLRAVEFRYFWLEILALPEALAAFAQSYDFLLDTIRELCESARRHYFSYMVREEVRKESRYRQDIDHEALETSSTFSVGDWMKTSLSSWFSVDPENFSLSISRSVVGRQPDEVVAEYDGDEAVN